jgi:site-specific DNA-methyltransferase (adenine-specific)
MQLKDNIIHGDCIEVLGKVKRPFADLIFADPPFNIGYTYDLYDDNIESKKYLDWTRTWIAACQKVLKANGSFYIAIGDEYVANVKCIADNLGLILRNWIIWHYTFGQQTQNKFARAHTHILYFVNNAKHFTFNDQVVRIISDRQKKYRDKRANPEGKMPDDVWNEYPRVCGTFKERVAFPCQMPEGLLARIIRVSSNEDDWVLDPFSGSATTAAVAAALNRHYTGIELSRDYADSSKNRLKHRQGFSLAAKGHPRWTDHLYQELKWLYQENKVPYAQLLNNPMLQTLFTNKFNTRLGSKDHPFSEDDVMDRLTTLNKNARLGPIYSPIVSVKSTSQSNTVLSLRGTEGKAE